MPILPFGGGSQLWVPCRGALLGRVEQEGGKTSSDQYPKARDHLEGANQVSPKSSPLQGMKAQPLQSLVVGEVTHASSYILGAVR